MCPAFALALPCLKNGKTGSVIKLTLPVQRVEKVFSPR